MVREGYIKSFVESKKYGFITGTNKKDYFFHMNDIDQESKNKIQDGFLVTFDEKATKKGYAAINITIQDNKVEDTYKYIVPKEVYISKESKVKGWDIIENCNFMLVGTSEDSPDDAKRDIIESAEGIDANALINFEYFKTTGSKPGTGSGTYKFTIHNYKANPIVIAKKSKDGVLLLSEVKQDLNWNANFYYESAKEQTKKSTIKMILIWSFVIILIYIMNINDLLKELGINEFYLGIGAIIFGFIFGKRINYNYWIEKIY